MLATAFMWTNIIILLSQMWRDFTGGLLVRNPPLNAGDVGSILGWGAKIPHAVRRLSLCTTTREVCVQDACGEWGSRVCVNA